MKTLALLFIVLMLSFGLSAQSRPATLSPAFCSDFPAATSACKSFKELVDHKDKEILDILDQQCRVNQFVYVDATSKGAKSKGDGATYVCFDEREDRFLAVAFSMPASWEKNHYKSYEFLGGKGVLCFDEYKRGMPGGSQRYSYLDWKQNDPFDNATEGVSPPGDDPQGRGVLVKAMVDPWAVSVSYSFTNGTGGTTDYKLTIRRSTKRFVETYDADKNTYTETGHCAVSEGKSKWQTLR